MPATSTTLHVPPTLSLNAFDEEDAFDDKDDGFSTGEFTFSPDAMREELARNMAELEDTWEDESLEEPDIKAVSDHNTSVSTLDIDPSTPGSMMQDIPLELSTLSPQLSKISLSPHTEPVIMLESVDEHEPHSPNGVHRHTPSPEGLPAEATGTAIDDAVQPDSTTPPGSPAPVQRPSFSSHDRNRPQPASAPADVTFATSQSLPVMSAASQMQRTSTDLVEKVHPASHRSQRSAGPSIFEKVRSKTRPTFLPPKPRQEDDKHLADWQQMMKMSRLAAEKRRKQLQERRYAREKAIEESLHIWEKHILPDWKVVNRNPEFRKLWWKGIPSKLRGQLWEKAVGNQLALSKEHYRTCLSRAKRALSAGVFPQETLDALEQDISNTLPTLHIFKPGTGPLYFDLKDMLCAWVVSRSDEGLGYVRGAAKIAAMILLNLAPQQGFVVMRNLLERHCMRSFFGGERTRDDVEAYYRIFDTMLADGMPKIYFNFKQHQISPREYLPDWLISLFLEHLPFEACARLWDVLVLEGDSFLYRASLGILAVLEPRLFFPDRKELLELLKGENKAAIEVAKREGQSMEGGRYEIYGVDEETLWDRIDDMKDWWKENTWVRLIQRELPDI